MNNLLGTAGLKSRTWTMARPAIAAARRMRGRA
jgi:hypothetical protein